MRKLNNNKRLDNSSGIGSDNANKAMQPASQTKKTPWHLRFAPGALNLKEMAATAGIGLLYGLLFASLLFAPLLPHLAAQTSSTNQPTQAGGPGVNLYVVTSDGTTYGITSSTAQLQDGAQPQWLWSILSIAGGTGVRIA